MNTKLTTAQRFKIADDKATQRTGIKERLEDYVDFWLDIRREKYISYAKQMQYKYLKK